MAQQKFLDGGQALAVRAEFGSPVYVYDEATLLRQADRVLAFPNAYGLTARYAMKALPNAAVIRVLTGAGLLLGYVALMTALAILDPVLATQFGLRPGGWWPSTTECTLMLVVFMAGLIASLVPAYRVYRITLADGLSSAH